MKKNSEGCQVQGCASKWSVELTQNRDEPVRLCPYCAAKILPPTSYLSLKEKPLGKR